MTFPGTRSRTYSDDTPVISGDLNDWQDAIIGWKHGDLSLLIHPAAFVAIGTHFDPAIGAVVPTGAGGPFYPSAPLLIPEGRRIKTIQFFYNRNGAGSVWPMLRSLTLATGTVNFPWNGTDDATGSAVESQLGTLDHTMLDGNAYNLVFKLTDVANRVHGAKVVFDAPA